MERDKQIERMNGAERRASAFFARVLSTPAARAVLERGNQERPKKDHNEDVPPAPRAACG